MNTVIFSTASLRNSKTLANHIRDIKNKGGVIWTSPYSYLVQRECLKQGILPNLLTPAQLYRFTEVEVFHYVDNTQLLRRLALRDEANAWLKEHTADRLQARKEHEGYTRYMKPKWNIREENLTDSQYVDIDDLLAVCHKYGIPHNVITDLKGRVNK